MPRTPLRCPECDALNRVAGGTDSAADRARNWRCSECDEYLPCPVCEAGALPNSAADPDPAPRGWFIGESTAERLPCDFCNVHEAVRQRRQPSY